MYFSVPSVYSVPSVLNNRPHLADLFAAVVFDDGAGELVKSL